MLIRFVSISWFAVNKLATHEEEFDVFTETSPSKAAGKLLKSVKTYKTEEGFFSADSIISWAC